MDKTAPQILEEAFLHIGFHENIVIPTAYHHPLDINDIHGDTDDILRRSSQSATMSWFGHFGPFPSL